ncbi:MAG: chemotaxis protein CheB [Xanthomonadales bacterium]|nr:chemotaxis protein CheB [Xanthomonadales bacterium]
MSDTTPSIALLFDDTALVATLREALDACGARIVHEGPVTGVNQDLLQELDADVLVINLDDAAADALDRLYALVDGERPRLVFNDAAASADLVGWDRARWARHLAAKVLQSGDVDPPRPGPSQARDVEVPTALPGAFPVEAGGDNGLVVPAPDRAHPFAGSLPMAVDETVDATKDDEVERSRGDTEALSAELEALLASAELADNEDEDVTGDAGMLAPDGSASAQAASQVDSPDMGLDRLLADLGAGQDRAGAGQSSGQSIEPAVVDPPGMGLDELVNDLGAATDQAGESLEPPGEPAVVGSPAASLDELLDDLGAEDDAMKDLPEPPTGPAAAATSAMGLDDLLDGRGARDGAAEAPSEPARPVVAPPAMGLDDVLGGMRLVGDDVPNAQASGVGTPAATDTPKAAPVLPSIPDDWALVDDDALSPATFGVEKQSAADFLAPEADTMALDDEPVLNLELVSMEEAVAPRPAPVAVEMHLDELQVALSRLVLTGSTLGGSGSAMAFYAALPADATMTFLHAQHLRGQSVAELVAQLGAACPLPVALAADGVPTRPGQVLVVPPGYTVRIHRDARVDVKSTGEEEPETSIDDSFTRAAEIFGRDALAIVFSGHNTDSIAGAKALHAAGGRVWVETAANEYADMVHEITAAGVVEYAGTPQELAARLAEKQA